MLAGGPPMLLHAADETAKPAEVKPPVETPAPAAVASPDPAKPEITLSIGQSAPPLFLGSWVKGEPVAGLNRGQVYVVEFWATWCGPCLAGMPHISKLQTDYGEKVRIIGISREKEDVVREWLTKEREEGVTWDQTVTYSLAMDADNVMYETWFRAAGRTGIPSAFLVGVDGIIEWIGHPARIDEPLAKVVDGSWDRQAAIAEYQAELKRMQDMAEASQISRAIAKARAEKNMEEALSLANQWIEKMPDFAPAKLTKLNLLAAAGQSDEATALRDQLVASDWEKGEILSTIASGIASGTIPGTPEDAEKLARHAAELHPKAAHVQYALARVYAELERWDDAIAATKQALELAEGNAVLTRYLKQLEGKKAAAENKDSEKQDEPKQDGASAP